MEVELAKPHLDIGLFTSNEEAMLNFWQQEVGLAFEETLPLGQGAKQQRHSMNGGVLKINVSPDSARDGSPTGYRHLNIAREGISEPQSLTDPDGNSVTLVPPGHDGITTVRLDMAVRDEQATHHFLGKVLGLQSAGQANTYKCGETLIHFEYSDKAEQVEDMQGKGIRYITMQVKDVDKEHAGFVERGATEGRAPASFGDVARISFIRDPDGNWIEISQRASLTGGVPSGG